MKAKAEPTMVQVTEDMIMSACTFHRVNIEDLSEEDARAVFGDGVYETWREMQGKSRTHGTLTVTGIGRESGTITVGPGPTSPKR